MKKEKLKLIFVDSEVYREVYREVNREVSRPNLPIPTSDEYWAHCQYREVRVKNYFVTVKG